MKPSWRGFFVALACAGPPWATLGNYFWWLGVACLVVQWVGFSYLVICVCRGIDK